MKNLLAVLLIMACSIPALSGQTLISVDASPQVYLSFDQEYDADVPMRIQYGGKASADVYYKAAGPLFITAGFGLGTTSQSEPYGLVVQRAFTSLTGSAGISMRFNQRWGISIKTHGNYSTYTGSYVKFSHMSLSLDPYLTIIDTPLRISITGNIGYDWRRDIDHNLYGGVGLSASLPFRGDQ
jgi:hypothetical protein